MTLPQDIATVSVVAAVCGKATGTETKSQKMSDEMTLKSFISVSLVNRYYTGGVAPKYQVNLAARRKI
jgi:hypothetical protein